MEEKQRVVCVLGMHRSGTSMLTKLISVLGFNVGHEETLLAATISNEEGYWENKEIVRMNDEILELFNMTWYSDKELPKDWETHPLMEEYKNQLKNLIEKNYNEFSMWVFKDPRTSMLIPIWKKVLEELNVEVQYIIAVRNPLDVASSLNYRDGLPLEYGLKLWMLYNKSIITNIEKEKILFVSYEELLKAKETIVLEKIAPFLEVNTAQIKQFNINDNINIKLHHHSAELSKISEEGGEFIAQCYSLMHKFCTTNFVLDGYNKLVDVFSRYERISEICNSKPLFNYYSHFFIDEGDGYNDANKVSELCKPKQDVFHANYTKERNDKQLHSLRFEPIEGVVCSVKILSFDSNVKDVSVKPLNHSFEKDGWYEFLTLDPIFEITGELNNLERLEIKYDIKKMSYEKFVKLSIREKQRLTDSLSQTCSTINKLQINEESLQLKCAEIEQNYEEQITQFKEELSRIKSLKIWKIWCKYKHIKEKLYFNLGRDKR